MATVLKVLILAGWSGTRLWPLSRKYYPKQFLQLEEFDNVSFFEQALARALELTSKENIFVVTNERYKFHCLNQADISESNILIEPVARNTLGAIMLGMDSWIDSDTFLVLSSDHVIEDGRKFTNIVLGALNAAQESIVTFWVKPTSPNTGYWYIQSEPMAQNALEIQRVVSFHEKPNQTIAEEYISKGYYWNAGIFMFSKKIFLRELQKWNPEYFDLVSNGKLPENFEKLPDLSIDYGLLEKSNNIRLAPLDLYWNDLGSFDAFDEHFEHTHHISPKLISKDGGNNLVLSEVKGKIVTTVGISDIIIVDTPDALLISKKWQSQKTKEIVWMLEGGNGEVALYGNTVYRPWGSYTIIDEWVGFKTKRLTVLPGKKLSSQLHHHRSEHWVVVSGTAKVTLDDKEILLRKGESTYIPIGMKHRLENCGKLQLHIIESQIGDYLEEDDIVRFEDSYGRK